MITVTNDLGTFRFTRDNDGVGYWYVVRGTVPGALHKVRRNIAVPNNYAAVLRSEAIKAGTPATDVMPIQRTAVERQAADRVERKKASASRPKSSRAKNANKIDLFSL